MGFLDALFGIDREADEKARVEYENYVELFDRKEFALRKYYQFSYFGSDLDTCTAFLYRLNIPYVVEDFPVGYGWECRSDLGSPKYPYGHNGETEKVILIPKSQGIRVIERAWRMYLDRKNREDDANLTSQAMKLLSKIA